MEWTVRAVGRISSVADLRNTVVALRGTTPVLLGDVATVVEAPAVRRGIAHRLKGEVVSCRVTKQFGADTVVVARGIRAAIEGIQRALPEGRHPSHRLRPVAARSVRARRRRPRGADRRLPGRGHPVPAPRRLEGGGHRHRHHPALDRPGGHPSPLRPRRDQHHDPGRPRHRGGDPGRRRHHRHGEHHPSLRGRDHGRGAPCAGARPPRWRWDARSRSPP